MPVIGHAVAGLAIAAWGDASGKIVRPERFSQRVLLLVALSYLPDLTAQLGVLSGFRGTPVVTHSVLFAGVASLFLGPVVGRISRLSFRHAFALIAVSMLLHDGMDILQSPRRMPFWPAPLVVNVGRWIPPTLQGEVLACLPLLGAALAYVWWKGALRRPTRRDWASLAVVVVIVTAATAFSDLRSRRARALNRARILAETGQYAAALELSETADAWPHTTPPGRIDYVRGVAWWGLGRRDLAEQYYLRSYAADSDYLWVVADLAALYASSDEPIEQRRRKAGPWLTILQDRFRTHPAFNRLVARVERALTRTR